ncbi:3-keto-disaccharide hydrolase [Aporhodopirellula aestuarii]|uniref:DUF1080 domain-containing protein n=1 Tax=Aporhodopirellula aestuarii TaxID=2950107 RepID=A0ABT0UAB7_9BACT|nr:DUF1080 domain-containing protein [Aporhodopirellula aestuarii]MCM2373948.1 DUF1080 domain-containing protein [Aporhodopirellula aestuarii]
MIVAVGLLLCMGATLFGQQNLFAQSESWMPEPGFSSLFNGKDLSGWCFRVKTPRRETNAGAVIETFDGKTKTDEDHRYSANDGVLTVSFPEEKDRLTGQLYTVAEFPENFVLKLEFRASVNADSGIFIRKPQLQCRDYLVAGPYNDLKYYKPQDWNLIEVTVNDGVAHCTCNGEVLEAALELPETGPIGLEGDRGKMEYRHLQLKKLP